MTDLYIDYFQLRWQVKWFEYTSRYLIAKMIWIYLKIPNSSGVWQYIEKGLPRGIFLKNYILHFEINTSPAYLVLIRQERQVCCVHFNFKK